MSSLTPNSEGKYELKFVLSQPSIYKGAMIRVNNYMGNSGPITYYADNGVITVSFSETEMKPESGKDKITVQFLLVEGDGEDYNSPDWYSFIAITITD